MIARSISLVLAASYFAWPITANAESPSRFRHWKEIERAASEQDSEAAFLLDSDIYAATRSDLADLRIFDDADAETPYILEIESDGSTPTRREVSYSLQSSSIEQDRSGKRTIVIAVTRREPIASFTLQTTSANFSRRVIVEGIALAGAREDWQPIASATLERVELRGRRREQLSIDFAPARHEKYRLTIENRDSPPLENVSLTVRGTVHRASFVARGARTYRAAYGAAKVRPPQYDIGAVLKDLPREPRPVASMLGEERSTDQFQSVADGEQSLLDNWYFLGSAIGAMAAVLCWALYGAGRRLRKVRESESTGT